MINDQRLLALLFVRESLHLSTGMNLPAVEPSVQKSSKRLTESEREELEREWEWSWDLNWRWIQEFARMQDTLSPVELASTLGERHHSDLLFSPENFSREEFLDWGNGIPRIIDPIAGAGPEGGSVAQAEESARRHGLRACVALPYSDFYGLLMGEHLLVMSLRTYVDKSRYKDLLKTSFR